MTDLAGQQYRVEAEGVLDRSEVWWLRLREIIRTGSLKPGDFVLSSGHTNTFLFQLRQTRDCPHRRLELGAAPIVSAVAAVSHVKGFRVDAFLCERHKMSTARENVNLTAPTPRKASSLGRRRRARLRR
ncbi:MAG: hypothetical protein WCC90_02480 [Methylocella sp.]